MFKVRLPCYFTLKTQTPLLEVCAPLFSTVFLIKDNWPPKQERKLLGIPAHKLGGKQAPVTFLSRLGHT